MKTILILLYSLAIALSIKAQESDHNKHLGLYFDMQLEAGSENVSAKFLNRYINGGAISQEVKDGFTDKLKSKNLAGALWVTDLNFKIYSGKSSYNRKSFNVIGFENYYQYEAEFSKDMFLLYFNGNKQFEDKKADLSNMTFSQLKFQTFKVGIYRVLNHFGLGVNGGLVFGQNYLEINSGASSLYSAPFGQYITLDIEASGKNSLLDKDKFLSLAGVGLSFDFKLEYIFNEDAYFGIKVDRLGKIKFNDNSLQSVDTSYKFEGIVVKNLLDSFAIDLKSPQEFRDDLVQTSSIKNVSKSLPAAYTFYFNYYFINKKLRYYSQLKYIPSTLYKISFQNQLELNLLKSLQFGLCAGVGAYSNWNIGVSAGIKAGKFLFIGAEANSLLNFSNLDGPASAIGAIRAHISF